MLYGLEQGTIPRKLYSEQIMTSVNLPKGRPTIQQCHSPGWQFAPYNYVVSLLSAIAVDAVTNLLLSVIQILLSDPAKYRCS